MLGAPAIPAHRALADAHDRSFSQYVALRALPPDKQLLAHHAFFWYVTDLVNSTCLLEPQFQHLILPFLILSLPVTSHFVHFQKA